MCQLKAAVVCANPWNLEISSKDLKRSFIGLHVYQRVLGSECPFACPLVFTEGNRKKVKSRKTPANYATAAMRKLSANHKAEIERYTSIDYKELTQLTYLWEFDRAYQCPTWGYPTEEAYYRDASSVDALLGVRVPLLALNAADDPIASRWALPYPEARRNPYTVLCTTSLGGHLGWFEVGGGRWHSKPVSAPLPSSSVLSLLSLPRYFFASSSIRPC